jgi:hypothetical protein
MTRISAIKRIFGTGAATAFCFIWLGLSFASAGESLGSLISAGLDKLCAGFGVIVSASEGNFGSRNPFGCLGAFQFCPATFVQFFAGTAEEFLNNPSAQTAAWTNYEKTQWELAKKGGLTKLGGQALTFAGKSIIIDQSAILMACQFGCGKLGKLANYAASANCDARNVKDGNGVSVCSYLVRGVGKEVSCFTGGPPTVGPTVGPAIVGPAIVGPAIVGPGSVTPNNGQQAVATCGVDSVFGKEGPVEILVGRYTLKFGTAASTDTISKYINILNEASK